MPPAFHPRDGDRPIRIMLCGKNRFNMETQPIVINLSEADVNDARLLARDTLDLFQNRAGYYTNSKNNHFRGKLGEIAVSRYLLNRKGSVIQHYRDLSNLTLCDLEIVGNENRIRVEVKTWSNRFWDDLGRCVAVGQYHSISNKADIVIWCTSPDNLQQDISISIQGYSTMKDIIKAPAKYTGYNRLVHNYQVDAKNLRSIEQLL